MAEVLQKTDTKRSDKMQIETTANGNIAIKKTWKGKNYLLVVTPQELDEIAGFINRFARQGGFWRR